MDLRETYNRIADDWAREHATDTWSQPAVERFCSLLKPGSLILDVGCGPGLKAKFFVEQNFQIFGIDISERMIELAKESAPTASFKVLELAALDQLGQTFDGVFAQAILLHVPKNECAKAVIKMADKLRPGGHIFLAVKEKREGRGEEEVVKENSYGYVYERFFSYFRAEEVCNYVRQAGLEVVHEEFVGSEGKRWIIVFGKKFK